MIDRGLDAGLALPVAVPGKVGIDVSVACMAVAIVVNDGVGETGSVVIVDVKVAGNVAVGLGWTSQYLTSRSEPLAGVRACILATAVAVSSLG